MSSTYLQQACQIISDNLRLAGRAQAGRRRRRRTAKTRLKFKLRLIRLGAYRFSILAASKPPPAPGYRLALSSPMEGSHYDPNSPATSAGAGPSNPKKRKKPSTSGPGSSSTPAFHDHDHDSKDGKKKGYSCSECHRRKVRYVSSLLCLPLVVPWLGGWVVPFVGCALLIASPLFSSRRSRSQARPSLPRLPFHPPFSPSRLPDWHFGTDA